MTTKSAASTFVDAFGSERNASFVGHVHVSHGIDADAVFPLIVSATVDCRRPSRTPAWRDVPAGTFTMIVRVAAKHGLDGSLSPVTNSTYRVARWLTETCCTPSVAVMSPVCTTAYGVGLNGCSWMTL